MPLPVYKPRKKAINLDPAPELPEGLKELRPLPEAPVFPEINLPEINLPDMSQYPALTLPAPKDFKYFQGIQPDLQQIKQYEATTGRTVTPAVMEGMTAARLKEAAGKAVDVGQLNLQRNLAAENRALALHGAETRRFQTGVDIGITGSKMEQNRAIAEADIATKQAIAGFNAETALGRQQRENIKFWQDYMEDNDTLDKEEIAAIRDSFPGIAATIESIRNNAGYTDVEKESLINEIYAQQVYPLWQSAVRSGADWGEYSRGAFDRLAGSDIGYSSGGTGVSSPSTADEPVTKSVYINKDLRETVANFISPYGDYKVVPNKWVINRKTGETFGLAVWKDPNIAGGVSYKRILADGSLDGLGLPVPADDGKLENLPPIYMIGTQKKGSMRVRWDEPPAINANTTGWVIP